MIGLEKMRCEKCKHYRGVYIHPWSVGIDRDKIGAYNAHACIVEEDVYKNSDEKPVITVTIGKTESIGCEMFTEID